MALPRAPLTPISSNIIRYRDLSPYLRGCIDASRLAGLSLGQIAHQYNLPKSTVSTSLRLSKLHPEGASQKRSGRPKETSERAERWLVRTVRLQPKLTYKDLIDQSPHHLSHDTIYRVLKQNGITNWRAKKRPLLTPEHAGLRLRWAEAHINWSEEQWSKILWSDECSVERGTGKRPVWVFRTPHQKWDKDMVEPYKKGKDLSTMIWSAFSGKWGRLEAYILERDFDSKKHGYSAKSYIDCLKDNLPQHLEPGLLFMQDNAPIHTARATLKWLEDNNVVVIEWPPYSPDLNPIEHLWKWLKEKLHELYPHLQEVTGPLEEVQDYMERAIRHAWREIDQDKIDCLWRTMRNRCEAVINAEGWYTKY